MRFLLPLLLLLSTTSLAQSVDTTTTTSPPSTRGWYLSTQSELALTGTFGDQAQGGLLELYATRIGYGVTDNLLIGAQIGVFGVFGGDGGGGFGAVVNVAPFLRYYLAMPAQRTRLFMEIGLGLNESQLIYFDGESPRYHAALGLERRLTRGVYATAFLAYNGLEAGESEVSLSLGFNNFLRQLNFYDGQIGFSKGQFVLDNSWGVISLGGGSRFKDIQENRQRTVDLTPNLGYFITNRLLAEATLTYERRSRKTVFEDDSFDERLEERGGAEVGLRYLLSPASRAVPYLAVSSSYSARRSAFGGTSEPINSDSFFRSSAVSFTGAGGVLYRLRNQLLLDTNLSYRATSTSLSDGNARSGDIRIGLGLMVLLKR